MGKATTPQRRAATDLIGINTQTFIHNVHCTQQAVCWKLLRDVCSPAHTGVGLRSRGEWSSSWEPLLFCSYRASERARTAEGSKEPPELADSKELPELADDARRETDW